MGELNISLILTCPRYVGDRVADHMETRLKRCKHFSCKFWQQIQKDLYWECLTVQTSNFTRFRSFALDSAEVNFDVWTRSKLTFIWWSMGHNHCRYLWQKSSAPTSKHFNNVLYSYHAKILMWMVAHFHHFGLIFKRTKNLYYFLYIYNISC